MYLAAIEIGLGKIAFQGYRSGIVINRPGILAVAGVYLAAIEIGTEIIRLSFYHLGKAVGGLLITLAFFVWVLCFISLPLPVIPAAVYCIRLPTDLLTADKTLGVVVDRFRRNRAFLSRKER